MSDIQAGTAKVARTAYQRLSTFDIAMKGKARADREDLFYWRLGQQRRVNFTIYMGSPAGVEYEICRITRIATHDQAVRGRARWQSFGLDRKHHTYPTRRKAIRTGKGRGEALADETGLPDGVLAKVLGALGGKGFISFKDGATKVLLLPSGAPMTALSDKGLDIRILKPVTPPAPAARPAAKPRAAVPPAPPARRAAPASKDGPARRFCLGCGGTFNSSGIGNRLCAACRKRSEVDVYGGVV